MTIGWLMVLVVSVGLLTGCDVRAPRTSGQQMSAGAQDEYTDQMRRNEKLIRDAERQSDMSDAAFAKREEQDKHYDTIIERQVDQSKRYDKLLDKWEQQAVRFDALLDRAEKGLKE